MTVKVSQYILRITMYGFSTVTQKGQIVIPSSIRRALKIRPATRMQFEIQGNAIMIRPTLTIEQACGMFKTDKHFTKADYKKAIEEAVVEKFKRKLQKP